MKTISLILQNRTPCLQIGKQSLQMCTQVQTLADQVCQLPTQTCKFATTAIWQTNAHVCKNTSLENNQHAHQCCKFCKPSCCITQNMHIHVPYLCTQTLKYCKKRILFAKNAAKSFHVCKPMCCTLATTSFANLQNKSWRVFRTKHAHSQTKRTRVRAKPIYANQEFANLAKPYADVHTKFVVATWQAPRANVQTKLASLQKRHCANSLCCKISAKVMQRLYIHDASLMRTIWKTRCASSLNKFCNVAR